MRTTPRFGFSLRCFQLTRAAAVFALSAVAFTLAAHGAELRRDVEYGRAGETRLLLDASIPDGPGPYPIAILVHGGGWSSGDKAGSDKPGNGADVTPWFAPLQKANFVYFSINYRYAPANRWPACFEDVETAIRWAKAHAAEYKGDPKRIAIFGHSAGGHLACLAGTETADDVRVQAVVGYAAVTDLVSDTEKRGGLSKSLQQLFDAPEKPTPEILEKLRLASPIARVKPGLPPFLLLHGDADKTVALQQSIEFQKRLRETGNTCDLIVISGAPHGLLAWEKLDPTYADRMIAWLREKLDATNARSSAQP